MKPGSYTNDNTDLLLTVFKVYAISKGYYKIRGILTNKRNGIVYEKIKRVLITHNLKRIGSV